MQIELQRLHACISRVCFLIHASPRKPDSRQPDTWLAADTYGISQYLAEPLIGSYLNPWTTTKQFSVSKPPQPRACARNPLTTPKVPHCLSGCKHLNELYALRASPSQLSTSMISSVRPKCACTAGLEFARLSWRLKNLTTALSATT